MEKIALVSVSDKTGIVELCKELKNHNFRILATGGTAVHLTKNNIEIIEVSDFTGFKEILDGRVKTLHPKIFGGILFRRDNKKDIEEVTANDISAIDLVVVNLYPFEKVAERGEPLEDLIENIDIGGPSLIRASAKNFKFVSVLTSPIQYDIYLEKLKSNSVNEEYRIELALKAFEVTAAYDSFIVNTLNKKFRIDDTPKFIYLKNKNELRYGENPHQKGFLYGNFEDYFEKIHGKELSYNNILDIEAAIETLQDLNGSASIIVKHNNPCGAAIGNNILDAYLKSYSCDPVSAFGGIVAVNGIIDKIFAEELNKIFLEVIIAEGFSNEALEPLKKKKDRRLLIQKKKIDSEFSLRSIPGGFLVQEKDKNDDDFLNLSYPTVQKVNDNQLNDLKFAWSIVKNVKSNAIVIAKNMQTIGIGCGQVSRVDSVKIAMMKAKEFGFDTKDAVAASDAFFPFPDNIELLASHGISAVIQPGGSIRDNEVIQAADLNNISMVFTGKRHFKH